MKLVKKNAYYHYNGKKIPIPYLDRFLNDLGLTAVVENLKDDILLDYVYSFEPQTYADKITHPKLLKFLGVK